MNFDPQININLAKSQIYSMAELVKKAVETSIVSLVESKSNGSQHVIDDDQLVNAFEIEIDTIIYHILAIVQLPPESLRYVLSIQKISTMLERIGDHAVNITESALSLAKKTDGQALFDLPKMAALTEKVLHDSLKSFFKNDIVLAQNVLTRDEEIDGLNILITSRVKEKVLLGSMTFERAMEIIRVCKNFERIADLASNIAEEASFSISGQIVKHNAGVQPDFNSQQPISNTSLNNAQ
jgi:phosphate transport system protein